MPSATLSASSRNLLLTAHVAASVSVLGADLVLLLLGVISLSGADPLTIYPAAHLVGAWVVRPLALLTLATGLALGLLTPWGLFRYWWVTIKLTIVAVLTGAVLFVLVPRLGAAAEAAAGPGADPFTVGERLPLVIAPAVASTLLLLALALAVFKPSWRLRRHDNERSARSTVNREISRHA
jgi:hypothetical protein